MRDCRRCRVRGLSLVSPARNEREVHVLWLKQTKDWQGQPNPKPYAAPLNPKLLDSKFPDLRAPKALSTTAPKPGVLPPQTLTLNPVHPINTANPIILKQDKPDKL